MTTGLAARRVRINPILGVPNCTYAEPIQTVDKHNFPIPAGAELLLLTFSSSVAFAFFAFFFFPLDLGILLWCSDFGIFLPEVSVVPKEPPEISPLERPRRNRWTSFWITL